jgi:hypothetical protein
MTPKQQHTYDRRVKVQALRKRCPDLYLSEIAERFGISATQVKQDLQANLDDYRKENNC